MRAVPIAALSLLLGCGLALCPQQAEAQDSTLTLKVTANLVLSDVLVEDRSTHQAVGLLTADDLLVREDCVAQQIQYLSSDTLPLSIVFLFDLTGTVHPVLKPLAASARTVLDRLRPQDEAAVMVFYSTTQLLQPFTHDRDLLAAAIGKASTMTTPETTFLNEDVFQATEVARQATEPLSRRVLLFLTDGTSDVPSAAIKKIYGKSAPERLHTEPEAMEALLRSGAAASALIERSGLTDVSLATRYLPPLGPLMRLGGDPGDIRKYAEESGGIVLHSSKQEVVAKLAELIDAMRTRYTLGYRPSATQPEGKFCRIAVELTPHFFATHPELTAKMLAIHAKRGYYR
ncbi:MAG: VWA domain-containing protein [Terracidiphilus sp.]